MYSFESFSPLPRPLVFCQFTGFVAEISTVVNKNSQNVKNVFHDFSISVTSQALQMNSTWPMVRIPDYDRRIEAIGAISQLRVVTLFPIIRTMEARTEWEKFSVIEGAEYIRESYLKEFGTPMEQDPFILPFVFHPSIDEFGNETVIPATTPPPWIIAWQAAPYFSVTAIMNMDVTIAPVYSGILESMEQTRAPVLTAVEDLNSLQSEEFRTEQPTSIYNEPVFKDFSDDAEVVASIQAILPWNVYLEDVLVEGTEAVHAVISNTCNQSYTYELQGPEAIYLGEGDRHELAFDSLGQTIIIEAFQLREGLKSCSYKVDI